MVTTRSSPGSPLMPFDGDTLALRSRNVASPALVRKRKTLGGHVRASPPGKRRRSGDKEPEVTTYTNGVVQETPQPPSNPDADYSSKVSHAGVSEGETVDLEDQARSQGDSVAWQSSNADGIIEGQDDEERRLQRGNNDTVPTNAAFSDTQSPAMEPTWLITKEMTLNTYKRFNREEPVEDAVVKPEVVFQNPIQPEFENDDMISDDEAPEVVSTQIAAQNVKSLPPVKTRKTSCKAKTNLRPVTNENAVLTKNNSDNHSAMTDDRLASTVGESISQPEEPRWAVAQDDVPSLALALSPDFKHSSTNSKNIELDSEHHKAREVRVSSKATSSTRHVVSLPPRSSRSSQAYKAQMLSYHRTEHRWKGSRSRFIRGVRV